MLTRFGTRSARRWYWLTTSDQAALICLVLSLQVVVAAPAKRHRYEDGEQDGNFSQHFSVANRASRLCDKALDGQILVDAKVYAEVQALAELDRLGEFELKGFRRPVQAFNVRRLTVNAGN